MSKFLLLLFYFICRNSVMSMPNDEIPNEQGYEIDTRLYIDEKSTDEYLSSSDEVSSEVEFRVQFYYESLSFGSWLAYTFIVHPMIRSQDPRLSVETYPYGFAQTYRYGRSYTFKCEHGPKECYGNKLHACTLYLFSNKKEAMLFNFCLINNNSNDTAVDECSQEMNVLPGPIKQCAKSSLGSILLKYFGDESKKVHYNEIPYMLINGEPVLNMTQTIRDNVNTAKTLLDRIMTGLEPKFKQPSNKEIIKNL